jgi:predicted transcriptional regulator
MLYNRMEEADIAERLSSLRERHGSFELLRERVALEGQKDPALIDDLMVWGALRQGDAQLESVMYYPSPRICYALTPKRMELLEYISQVHPSSIKELAQKVERDYKNVYDDVDVLQRFHLLEMEKQGKNRKPRSRIRGIFIELETGEDDGAA